MSCTNKVTVPDQGTVTASNTMSGAGLEFMREGANSSSVSLKQGSVGHSPQKL